MKFCDMTGPARLGRVKPVVRHCATIWALNWFSPVPDFEVIFVERMGPNYTHLERFVCGVVEHPQHDSCADGALCASAEGDFHGVFHVPIREFRFDCDLWPNGCISPRDWVALAFRSRTLD